MNNRLIEQLGEHIKFHYTFFDRIIVRGYIPGLFNTSNAIALLRNLNFDHHSNGVLRLLTDQLNNHISKVAEKEGVEIHWRDNIGGKKLQMQAWVEQKYLKENKTGVLCIIKSKENVTTLWNKDINTKAGKRFTKMYWCKKPVSQYYIYINDDVLGLCYLKISSYYPFYCEFYCNGHQYLKREFEKSGIDFRMHDNSFTHIEDVEKTKQLVENFSGTIIQDRIKLHWDKWFSFHKGERSRRNHRLEHKWYTTQAEICSNIIFKSPKFFNTLYDRFVEKHHRIGLPHSLSKIFDLKRTRKHSETTQKLYEQKVCIKHWIGSNSIKMYNKSGYLLRVETTINNPGLPGAKLHKPIEKLQGYYWYGHACNNRFFDALGEIDISAVSQYNEQMTKTVVTKKGKKVAAPDLRKEPQMALIETLTNARFCTEWFKVKELYPLLSEQFSKPTNIRYQMQKFIERGMIEKRKNTHYYRVTKKGHDWLMVSYLQNRYFVNPSLSKTAFCQLSENFCNNDVFEKAWNNINYGINAIYQQLNLKN